MSTLHHTVIGAGETPVVWCHGVFGQGKNFTSVAKALVASDPHRWRAILLDLPNHGRSPWTDTVSYPQMSDAVVRTIHDLADGQPVHLLGHSMGGKVAMRTVLDHPDLIRTLTVVDISPVRYNMAHTFGPRVQGMLTMPLGQLRTRADAEAHLRRYEPAAPIRQFLLQNLRRDVHAASKEQWYWQMNLPVIAENLPTLGDWPPAEGRSWDGPVLWMGGGNSPYVLDEYHPAMQELFAQVRRVTVKNCGHWVHADQPSVFVQVLKSFLAMAEQQTPRA